MTKNVEMSLLEWIDSKESDNPNTYYKLTEDNDVKPEIPWNPICEQLGKPRFRETGLRKSRFSLISENLRRDNERR